MATLFAATTWARAALARAPFEQKRVKGTDALREWERLKSEGRGWPVIVGDDEELADLVSHERRPAATILAAASTMEHPASLRKYREAEYMSVTGGTGSVDLETMMPPVGTWPSQPPSLQQIYLGDPPGSWDSRERVNILLIPARHGYEVPAYLDWGDWNECPSAEIHVAALGRWNRDYGAELVGMTGDSMDLRVSSRPASRDAALALAREQYLYAGDIVEQGVNDLSSLAALLMSSDWWNFWWD